MKQGDAEMKDLYAAQIDLERLIGELVVTAPDEDDIPGIIETLTDVARTIRDCGQFNPVVAEAAIPASNFPDEGKIR